MIDFRVKFTRRLVEKAEYTINAVDAEEAQEKANAICDEPDGGELVWELSRVDDVEADVVGE